MTVSAAVRLSPVPPALEADEEDGDLTGLEGVADGFAVAGLAGEGGIGEV